MGNSSAKPGSGLRLLAPLVEVRLLLMHVLLMRSDWLILQASWINYRIPDCSGRLARWHPIQGHCVKNGSYGRRSRAAPASHRSRSVD